MIFYIMGKDLNIIITGGNALYLNETFYKYGLKDYYYNPKQIVDGLRKIYFS